MQVLMATVLEFAAEVQGDLFDDGLLEAAVAGFRGRLPPKYKVGVVISETQWAQLRAGDPRRLLELDVTVEQHQNALIKGMPLYVDDRMPPGAFGLLARGDRTPCGSFGLSPALRQPEMS